MACDNDSSMGRAILGGGGGCFKGKVAKEVTVDHGYGDISQLHLCNSCAVKIVASAKRSGNKVSVKSFKEKKGYFDF